MSFKFRLFTPLIALLLAAPLSRPAQTPPPAGPDSAKIDELSRRIDELSRELERLKLGEAATAAPEANAAEVEAGRGMHGLGPAASKVYHVKQGLSIGGYGESLYQNFDTRRDDGAVANKTNQWDYLRAVVYLGWKFNDRFVFNSEIEYEHASTGKGGEVSVEFASLDAMLHRSANLRAGLLLAPVGWLNELHEPPVYLGARRPEVETQIIPSTWRMNGAGLFGDFGDDHLAFSYKLYAGESLYGENFSSAGIRGGRQSGAQAKADDLAFTGRLDYHGIQGLTTGVSFFHGKTGQDLMVNLDAVPGAETNIDATTTLWDVHADYRWRGLQTRALYTRIKIDEADLLNREDGINPSLNPAVPGPNGGVGAELRGWYLEAGYDVLGFFQKDGEMSLVPFARYEALDSQREVPAGYSRNPANDRIVRTLGINFKPHPQIVLKLDHQNFSNRVPLGGTGIDQWNAALGYLF